MIKSKKKLKNKINYKKSKQKKTRRKNKKTKYLKGGNINNLDLTSSELNEYKDVLNENPALMAMLDFGTPPPKKNNFNLEKEEREEKEEIDPIMLMIESVKSYNNNPNMNCKEVATFLENYDNAKKIFDNITQEELNAIILATNNHKFCDMYNKP
jgi:hypothetical protein